VLNVIRQYSDLIASWRVLLHEQDGSYARFKLEIDFHDGSKLHVKDYYFADGRKYAFHWSDANGKLKIRWDNAQHWRKVPTFPHHKHVGDEGNVVTSVEVTLADVLEYIRQNLSSSKNNSE